MWTNLFSLDFPIYYFMCPYLTTGPVNSIHRGQLPGTVYILDNEYGFHPPLLSLTHSEAIAMVPLHGSCDLVTVPRRAEPLSKAQVIYALSCD